MNRFTLPILALASAVGIQGILMGVGIVINDTPSLPKGIYQKKNRPVGKGCFVLFRLPTSELSSRPYARENLIKQVAAMEGDHVRISAEGVRVNGRMLANSVPLPTDRDGLPLPQLALDDYTLRAGELLTMSTYNPRSFDSRYFGPVRRDEVLSVIEPLFTW